MLHRAISIVAMVFLVVVSLSGAWLAVASAGLAINMAGLPPMGGRAGGPGGRARGPGGPPPNRPGMVLTSAQDARLPALLATTLRAARAAAPSDPIRVVRLRSYADCARGVVVTGGDHSQQLVFNAKTGKAMSDRAGIPPVPFPFGRQAHQIAKSIHPGDWFGMTGRWVDLFAGPALAYLALSGIVLYYLMWRRRRDAGRAHLVWR